MVLEAPTLKVPIPVGQSKSIRISAGHNPRILADTSILAREAILIRAREDIRTRVTQEPDTALIPTIVRVTIRMHRTRAASSLSFYAGSLAYWASTVFTLGRPELE